MRDELPEIGAQLSGEIERWRTDHPLPFYLGVWAFGFLAAFVAVWLAGEARVLEPAMAATGLAGGLALGARLRGGDGGSPRDGEADPGTRPSPPGPVDRR